MSAHEENQQLQSQENADGSIDNDIAQVESPEYQVRSMTHSYVSSQGDFVHLNPTYIYTNKADGTIRVGIIEADMIAKGIGIWTDGLNDDPTSGDDSNDERDERAGILEDIMAEVLIDDAPPAPGGESFMELTKSNDLRRNVIVPLQVNSSGETNDKKPSWLVLRGYPISQLEGLTKSFGGDEDPSIIENMNKVCPSLDNIPQFFESQTGTALGVNIDITHEGSKYFVRPACLIDNLRVAGEDIAENRRTQRDATSYQSTFANNFLDGINHSIAEGFIRDGQVVKDNDVYTSYKNDAAESKRLVLRVNGASADERGVPETIVVPSYPSESHRDVTERSSTELGPRPSADEELAWGPYGLHTE
ncbi:hypothetical protein L202_05835 [Cryptococcus amylolentus CBS 6039]|uniref:Uncharacterized protein n=1 Tax=Cryptococcus amylolentus CBS 6039 TaxID=1295533 RepID=A0A1E3HHL9_9TREE|nr:hypothetical protein L202_05835 [Cryptococcus amylolentus CBS 6039]ODN75839.1 hypothetical protein L202_05835 [Cryptococcus amylolentus CBS 6039]